MHLDVWLKRTGTKISALSKQTGLPWQTIHAIRRGRTPKYENAKKISDATGGAVTIEDIYSKRASRAPK